jgi:hypothetical protein
MPGNGYPEYRQLRYEEFLTARITCSFANSSQNLSNRTSNPSMSTMLPPATAFGVFNYRAIAIIQTTGFMIAALAPAITPAAPPYSAHPLLIRPLAFRGMIHFRRHQETSLPPSATVILQAGSFAEVDKWRGDSSLDRAASFSFIPAERAAGSTARSQLQDMGSSLSPAFIRNGINPCTPTIRPFSSTTRNDGNAPVRAGFRSTLHFQRASRCS